MRMPRRSLQKDDPEVPQALHAGSVISFVVLCCFAFGGCSSSPEPSQPSKPVLPANSYYYRLSIAHGRSLDTTWGVYALWLKIGSDSGLTNVPLTFWTSNPDSLIFSGTVQLKSNPDSIGGIVLSIDSNRRCTGPCSVLATGLFQSAT